MNNLNIPLGVMQGRLLPKYMDRYQAHPVDYWQKEFFIARDLGLQHIEFIVDLNDLDKNPIMSQEGIAELKDIMFRSGVTVKTICADCFIDVPLHSIDSSALAKAENILKTLIIHAELLSVSDIVIPCVDQSSLTNNESKERFIKKILQYTSSIEKSGVNLSLETDLDPEAFSALLSYLSSPRFTVNYDTGNSASLGYDLAAEFSAYGSRISHIHIKDRKLNGGSVILGTGDTDFEIFFRELRSIDYKGIFIMQPYRDDEGIEIFSKQLKWFNTLLAKRSF